MNNCIRVRGFIKTELLSAKWFLLSLTDGSCPAALSSHDIPLFIEMQTESMALLIQHKVKLGCDPPSGRPSQHTKKGCLRLQQGFIRPQTNSNQLGMPPCPEFHLKHKSEPRRLAG